VSSAKKRCETFISSTFEPDLLKQKPDINHALEAAQIILVRTSITNKNSKGDKGSPCHNPLDAEKKYVGDPLTKTAKDAEDIH